jgi:DNA-binding HxlR family transcriptional regulator
MDSITKPSRSPSRKAAPKAAPKPAPKPPAPRAAPVRAAATARRTAPDRQQRAKEAINAALELFNRRWVLRVLWELRGEPMSFRALQAACGDLSPTVLNQRLAELREAALVEAGEAGYALAPLGRELIAAFSPLTAWAVRWQGRRQ